MVILWGGVHLRVPAAVQQARLQQLPAGSRGACLTPFADHATPLSDSFLFQRKNSTYFLVFSVSGAKYPRRACTFRRF